MILEKIRKQVIRQFITKELLEDSIYPSFELTCSLLIRDYGDLDLGVSLIKDSHLVSAGEEASGKKFNEIQKLTNIDTKTLYKFIDYLEESLGNSIRISANKISSASRMAANLNARAKTLLLKSNSIFQNTEIIEEDFSNANNIDIDKTDAFIDFGNKFVTGKTITGLAPISISDKVEEVYATALSGGYLWFHESPGHSEPNMFTDSNSPWIHEMIMPSSFNGTVSASVKIRLSDSIDISRLLLTLNSNSSYFISVTGEIDGQFRILSPELQYTGYANIGFNPVNVSYIVITMKTSHSSGSVSSPVNGKLYSFSINNLSVELHEYAETSSLVMKTINTIGKFSDIAIGTVQTTPVGTDILYYASADGINFTEIATLESNKTNIPKSLSVLDISGLLSFSGTIDLSKSHPYIANNNISTSYSETSLTSIEKIEPKILRNLGGFKVESAVDNLVSCILFVDSDNMEFDFSLYQGYIDGTLKTNRETIARGFHSFKFNMSGGLSTYKSYLDSLVSSVFSYGSHIATRQDANMFMTISQDDTYDKFCFVNIGGSFISIVKMLQTDVISDTLPEGEQMLIIKRNFNTSSLAGTVSIRADFKSNLYNSPELKELKIKVI